MADSLPEPDGRAARNARAGTSPRVGVVVLNWNGAADTERCLSSLRSAEPRPAVVVVVDNASRPADAERLRGWIARHARDEGWSWAECEGPDATAATSSDNEAPWLLLQRLPTQRGFSGGNNVGIRTLAALADPTHFLLLNNDTEVAPDYFAALTDALLAAPASVLLSGTIHELERRERVWYAGGRFVPWRALALHDLDVPADAAPRPTAFITGCALVVSRAALDALGPLPECYFPAYMEDAEYCWRAGEVGVAVLYAPRPVVYHLGGASAGRATESPWPAYLNVRHRAFFARRNLRGARRLTALVYLMVTKPARAIHELARGRRAMAGALVRGLVSGLCSPAARQRSK